MDISYEDVLTILKIIEQSSCEELHLEIGDFKLIVRRKSTIAPSRVGGADPAAVSVEHETRSRDNGARVPLPQDAAGIEEAGVVIKAPMVGIFYRALAPGAPPFVEIGSVVDADDTVCIIEVMKLMNSIRAGCRGRVVQILAENGVLVEYGQSLVVVEPLP